jgi:type IV pilus assembly protein PilY1
VWKKEEPVMKRHEITIVAIALCLLTGIGLWPIDVKAQALADYTSSPPFITEAVPPNILLLMDNSGSMNRMAYDTSTAAFDPTRLYYGLFDNLECYTYGSNKYQPDPVANPTTLGTCGSSYPWSGNLLNYVSMRRIDVVKWVMMGGTCSVGGRDAQGGCRQLLGQNAFDNGACCADQTQSVSVANATGRMPSANTPSSGTVYFHLIGSSGTYKGKICVDDDSTRESCSDSDTFSESSWDIQVDIFENATGVIQQVGSKARFGLMEFKGAGDGGKVLSDVGSNVQDMLTGIESTTPSTWTPLSEALYEATRYYAQIPPAYTSSDYSYNVTNRDPYYFKQPDWASTSQYVKCCKSFVIVFTDGQPTKDTNIPTALKDYSHTATAHGTGDHCTAAGGCTGALSTHTNTSSSFHATLTDHHDNCSSYYGGSTGDSCPNDGSHYLDDVAYFAHITDLRQATIPVLNETGKDLAGDQKLTIYTFFAFGTGGNILSDAAKAGGFEDRNGNNLPDLPEEWDKVNNNTGAAGADGVPDTYYESDDADKLKDRLLAAITSILQRASAGTSVSVLATSSTGDGSLYQAYFYPTTFEGLNEVKWTGYTQGLFIDEFGNIREDSDADGKLIYQNDVIVRTRYDTATGDVKADRYNDSDGDGKADTTTPFETVGLKDVKPIWEAGRRLALMNSADRNIITWVDTDNDGVVDTGEQIAFTTTNATTLSPYLRASSAPFTASNIVSFIRGDQVTGLRDRQLTVTDDIGGSALKVWKFGDPIHSTPTVVGAPKERFDVIYGDSTYTTFFQKYKNRRQVAYVGANDGMLHAFNGGFYHRGDDPSTNSTTERGFFTKNATDNASGATLGKELWGFVPYQLLPHLKWLTQTDYTHVYYVDLKPKVTDVRIFAADDDHPGGWGTILIGGFRMGGSCGNCVASTGGPPMTVTADFGSGSQTRTFYTAYFVLDITNPEKDPVLLWTFSQSDMGLSTSYPAVLRVNPTSSTKTDNTSAKWYMVVGSGPTGYDGSSSQTAKLFAIDLKAGPKDSSGGSLVSTFSTGDANAFMGDVVTLDSDLDFRVDTSYAGNVMCNQTVPDPNTDNDNNPCTPILTPKWIGKMYRLTTGGGDTSTTTWGVLSGSSRIPTVLLATFPPTGTTLKVGPVTAPPTLTADDTSKIWVFFGTGRFYSTNDKTNTDTQYFIGVKDLVMTAGCTQTSATNCQQNDLVNVSSAVVCNPCATSTNQVTGSGDIGSVTSLLGTATTTLQGLVNSKSGWYTTLTLPTVAPTPRERVLAAPTILGGTVFFPTFIPNSDICTSSGDGMLYALFYLTGSAYKESVIGTTVVSGNTNMNKSISLGTGMSSQMAVHIGAQGSGTQGSGSGSGSAGRVTLVGQSSTGAVTEVSASPALASWSRYVSWINQRD